MANVWKHIDARPSLESVAETLQQTLWAMDGKSGRGLPITLTKYDGTSYALDAQSAEATNGNTFRAQSQNTLYGITLNNSRLSFVGGITLAAYTTGAVLFIGPGGLLSQDPASFYFNDTTDRLGVGARGTTQPAHELHVFGTGLFEGNLTAGGTVRSVGDFYVGSTTGQLASIAATNGDIASAGKVSLTPPAAITTFKRQFESTFTWSNGTTAMNAMILALTDTSSGSASTFFDCLSTGASKFSIRKDGAVTGAATPRFNDAPLWYAPLAGAATTSLSLTSSYVDLGGATVTLSGVGRWLVTASLDFQQIGVGDLGQTLLGQLSLGAGASADSGGVLTFRGGDGDRGTVFQHWIVTVSSGTPIAKLQVSKTAGAGTSAVYATQSKIIAVYFGNP